MSDSGKKKIVLIGTAHPFRGGLASYNERLIKEFTDQGHDAEIYTFTVQYPNFLFPGKTQFSEEKAPTGLRIKRCVNSVNPFNWLKIGNELKRLKPDIVIFKYWLPFMGPCFGTIARRIRKNKHTRIISILDNVIPHEKRFGDVLFTRYFLKPVHAFISMSKSVETDLRKFEPNKPCLFNPHPLFDNFGLAMSREKALEMLGLDPTKRYILFFGIIRDYKGLDWLLQAYAQLGKLRHEVKLLVAGEYYSNEEKYRTLIDELGLKEDVIVVNQFIKDSEVGRYFCAADLVAQPYKHATQSGVTQIAYHFETPILVTRVGGLPEMVPDQKVGYVTDPDPAAIQEAILDFYSQSRSDFFKANLVIEKDKYTWDKLSDKVLQLSKL